MTAIIIIICAALLILFAVYRTVQKARGRSKSSCCGTPEVRTVKKVDDTDPSHYPYRYTLSIDGMHCSNCARTVENELNSMDGVWGKVDLGKKEASVRTTPAGGSTPALSSSGQAPRTGDETDPGPALATALLSLLFIAGILFLRRRNHT